MNITRLPDHTHLITEYGLVTLPVRPKTGTGDITIQLELGSPEGDLQFLRNSRLRNFSPVSIAGSLGEAEQITAVIE